VPPAVDLTGIAEAERRRPRLAAWCRELLSTSQRERVESEHSHAARRVVRFGGVHELLEIEGLDAVTTRSREVVDTLQEGRPPRTASAFLESEIEELGGRCIWSRRTDDAGEDEERMLRTMRAAVEASAASP